MFDLRCTPATSNFINESKIHLRAVLTSLSKFSSNAREKRKEKVFKCDLIFVFLCFKTFFSSLKSGEEELDVRDTFQINKKPKICELIFTLIS